MVFQVFRLLDGDYMELELIVLKSQLFDALEDYLQLLANILKIYVFITLFIIILFKSSLFH